MGTEEFDNIFRDRLNSIQPEYQEGLWSRLEGRLNLVAPVSWWTRWGGWLAGVGLALTLFNSVYFIHSVGGFQQSEGSEATGVVNEKQSPEVVYLSDTVFLVDTVYLEKIVYRTANYEKDYLAGSETLNDYHRSYFSSTSAGSDRENSDKGGTFPATKLAGADNMFIPAASVLQGQSPFSGFQTLKPINPFMNKLYLTAKNLIPAAGENDPMGSAKGSKPEEVVSGRQQYYSSNPWQMRMGAGIGMSIPDPDLGRRYISQLEFVNFEFYQRKNSNFRILTGLVHHHLDYLLDETDNPELYDTDQLQLYPGFSDFDQEPESIQVRNQMLVIPFGLRYYLPLNNQWSVYSGINSSLQWLLNQQFQYEFLDVAEGNLVNYTESVIRTENLLAIGSLGGELGLEFEVSRRFAINTRVHYHYGFSRVGVEKRALNVLNFDLGMYLQLHR